MENNPRNAGRKPTGKIKHNLSLFFSPEVSATLSAMPNRSGWISEQIERIVSEADQPTSSNNPE
jgi:hypothetical protein